MQEIEKDRDDPPEVSIRMLGEFSVAIRGRHGEPPKFRSRTAERLLSWLALRLGHSISKPELYDGLWPSSDGDRQAQNLRRAISDVRQALEDGPEILLADGSRVWLASEKVQTDVARFKTLTDSGLEGSEPEANLRTALQLYAGPLLPGEDEPWIGVHRMELEERFAQAVEQMILLLLRDERHDEALRIGRHAAIAAPLREDVHIALIRAYASAGLRSQAISQFEELENVLSDHWGETPSAAAVQAFETLCADEQPRRPSTTPLSPQPEAAGGAMRAGSPFYIVRACDHALAAAIGRGEGTILIHGPRQVGKTSLLANVLNDVRRGQCKVAISDFQILGRSQMASADSLCRALAYGLVTQLGLPLDLPTLWNEWVGPNSNLHTVVQQVLNAVEGPVVWAMDEADRLFGTEFADDFFGLVRSWHNLRAMDSTGPFSRLTLAISYATEAHLFIQDVNQSPFNVGLRIPINDFNEVEIRELALRFGAHFSTGEISELMAITGGQPFLTRKALDALVHGGETFESLRAGAAEEYGPFGEHLRRLLFVASREEATQSEVCRFLSGQEFKDPKVALRLMAGGMLVRKPDGKLAFRVPAYRAFLTRYLLSG